MFTEALIATVTQENTLDLLTDGWPGSLEGYPWVPNLCDPRRTRNMYATEQERTYYFGHRSTFKAATDQPPYIKVSRRPSHQGLGVTGHQSRSLLTIGVFHVDTVSVVLPIQFEKLNKRLESGKGMHKVGLLHSMVELGKRIPSHTSSSNHSAASSQLIQHLSEFRVVQEKRKDFFTELGQYVSKIYSAATRLADLLLAELELLQEVETERLNRTSKHKLSVNKTQRAQIMREAQIDVLCKGLKVPSSASKKGGKCSSRGDAPTMSQYNTPLELTLRKRFGSMLLDDLVDIIKRVGARNMLRLPSKPHRKMAKRDRWLFRERSRHLWRKLRSGNFSSQEIEATRDLGDFGRKIDKKHKRKPQPSRLSLWHRALSGGDESYARLILEWFAAFVDDLPLTKGWTTKPWSKASRAIHTIARRQRDGEFALFACLARVKTPWNRGKKSFYSYQLDHLHGSRRKIAELLTGLDHFEDRGESASKDFKKLTTDVAMFYTSNGLLGFGPVAMEVGDEIAVALGARTPYVLRSDGEHTEIIGEVYVDGLTNGEIVELSKRYSSSYPLVDLVKDWAKRIPFQWQSTKRKRSGCASEDETRSTKRFRRF